MLEDILEDPKLGKVDGDAYRCYIRFLAMLSRSSSESGTLTLDARSLRYCACRQQTVHAEKTMSQLVDASVLAMSQVGDGYQTTAPNWAEIQGFAPLKKGKERKGKKRGPAASPPPSPTGSPETETPPHPARKEATEPGKTAERSAQLSSQGVETPEDAPGATIVSKKDVGVQQRGEVQLADAGGPAAPASRPKRGTLCPEDLTPEQRAKIRSWRDRKHPEIDDLMLQREWEKHSAYWRAEEKRRPNWVASFEKWLLKALEIQKSDPRAERSQPPAVKREKPPPPVTKEEIEQMEKDGDKARKERQLKRRRNRNWQE
jgi:hypothetical protein